MNAAAVVSELVQRPSEVVRVVVRDLGAASDEGSEAVAHRRDARQRGAVRVRAVVGVPARDDHGPLGLTDQRPVAAHDLGGGVDRLAAAGAEEDRGIGDR